jgi:hypothetical protein
LLGTAGAESMTIKQCLIPCDKLHRNLFKVLASEQGKTMKGYFHEIVDALIKERKA